MMRLAQQPGEQGARLRSRRERASGTGSLTFVHTVVEPNISTQGIAVLANTPALNGGTIRSVASKTDAELAHASLGHDPKHKVGWRPALSVADAQRREGINRAVELQVSVRDADRTGGPIPL